MTTIEVVCYKYKPLKNGKLPIKIRITKDRKVRYINLGVSTKPEHWDFVKNRPKLECPDKEHIEVLLANKIKDLRLEILKLNTCGKEYSATSLIQKVNNPLPTTVAEVFKKQMATLKELNRINYMLSIEQTYTSMLHYNNGTLDISFMDIDTAWLKDYEVWLRKSGKSVNTIGIHLRNIRMIYNLAIDKGIVNKETYPFAKYKVSKLSQKTDKRALSKENIMEVLCYPVEDKDSYTKLAIDLFSFSYFMGGINFVDMALLTSNNIAGDRLIYTRKKTSKVINLPLGKDARSILNQYNTSGTGYLFPILSELHKTEQMKFNRIHKVITKINKALKEVGHELRLPIKLTTYVARHSFATVLKRAGVSTSIISESLGHSSEKITQIYLDSFENSQIDEAFSHLK